jgi:hypothetical protein
MLFFFIDDVSVDSELLCPCERTCLCHVIRKQKFKRDSCAGKGSRENGIFGGRRRCIVHAVHFTRAFEYSWSCSGASSLPVAVKGSVGP